VDVSAMNPEAVVRLTAVMKEQHVPSEAFPIKGIDGVSK